MLGKDTSLSPGTIKTLRITVKLIEFLLYNRMNEVTYADKNFYLF